MDKLELHRNANNYLSKMIPLPNSPILMHYNGINYIVRFNRISETEWSGVYIDAYE